MSVESGKHGQVLVETTPVAEVTAWEFHREAKTTRYASSATGGFAKSLPGAKAGHGTIELKWNPAASALLNVGDAVTLRLGLNASKVFAVPAVIRSLRVLVPIGTGDYIAAVATFETDGAWSAPE